MPALAEARVRGARNLGMLKRIVGPTLLIEGPCMNHPPENRRLLRRDIEREGRMYPARARQYANAVFAALEKHAADLWRHRRLR